MKVNIEIFEVGSCEDKLKKALESQIATLDLVVNHKFRTARELEQVLAKLYDTARQIASQLGKFRIPISIRYGTAAESGPVDVNDAARAQYAVTAVGGTFDHLHDGHKILLSLASFMARDKLVVGVTQDKLLENKKFREVMQTYEERKDAVVDFVGIVQPGLPVECWELRDVAGPTAFVAEIEALVLSEETAAGGNMVNQIRNEKGLQPLRLFEAGVIGGGSPSDNWKDKLSSTKLRQMEYEEKYGKR